MKHMDSSEKMKSPRREILAVWERPTLHRLAANKAEGAKAASIDDGNQGGGNTGHHS